MARDQTLQGQRNQLITTIFGRRMGLNKDENLAGMQGVLDPIDGFSAGGSTIVSTSVSSNLPAYGVSMVGATGASATTAYTLAAPMPGVPKTLFNPTTGVAVILTSGAGALICSTGSAASTYGTITLSGKGCAVELRGLTTALWGVVTQIATSVSTNVAFV